MDTQYYTEYANAEARHWWFIGRRRLVQKVLNTLSLHPESGILEVGCGTGGNLEMLSGYGRLSAFELDEQARDFANAYDIVPVQPGALPDAVPFADTRFDLIVMLDVLEHIEDDAAALRVLHSRLAPQGTLLITVPAYMSLWSRHDEINHHKRRYTRAQLQRLLQANGFSVRYGTYFNTLLFPLIYLIRKLHNLIDPQQVQSDLQMPSPWINRILTTLFSIEARLVPRRSLPFGVSILMTAQRT